MGNILGSDNYSLLKVQNSTIQNMSNIVRYNGRTVHKSENLAEHSYYVAYFVYELGEMFKISQAQINKAVKIAICHDMGEIYTGDLPHSLKAYSSEIDNLATNIEEKMIHQNFTTFSKSFHAFRTEQDELVTTLVKAADCADVLMYINRERALGNQDVDVLHIYAESSERYIKLLEKLKSLTKEDKK